jgi:hypothetical protein
MEPNPQQFKAGDTVRQYRKKPVVIEAIQWNGKNHREMHDFLGGNPDNYMDTCGSYFRIDHAKVEGGLIILTLEGEHIATIGDWIIKGVKGEFYPCKPDIFAQTYEPAAPSQPAVEVWSVRDNEILLNNTFIFRVNNQLTANVICSELNRLENRVKELEGQAVDFLPVLQENHQAQIAGYYNVDKTDEERKIRNAVITEYADLISIYKKCRSISIYKNKLKTKTA